MHENGANSRLGYGPVKLNIMDEYQGLHVIYLRVMWNPHDQVRDQHGNTLIASHAVLALAVLILKNVPLLIRHITNVYTPD